jgi:outer membrane lipoprotein-sorting protein
MKIWVDRKKWWLLKVETLETNEDITTYVLKEHRANKKIDDSIFSFKIPQGSNIVDRRNPAEGDE